MASLTIQQSFDLALQHHQAGRLQEAEQLYRQILTQQPAHSNAMHYLGVLAHQVGQNDLAVDLIRRAIALDPNSPEAHNNLGNALKDLGQLDEAIAVYNKAITLKADYAQAHYNLGIALKDKGSLDEAIAAYCKAIALRPNYAEAMANLGLALSDKGQLVEAVAAYQQSITLNPNIPQVHTNLGVALAGQGQLDDAIVAHRHAIAVGPDDAEAQYNLGIALYNKGELDEAIAAYQRALVLKPSFSQAHNNLGNVLKDQGQLDEAIAAFRRAILLDPDNASMGSNLVSVIHFHPDYDARAISEEHRRWNRRHAQSLQKSILPHSNNRSPNRRLRIGYVSPHLREHPVGRFLLPLLSHHDRNQVEIFAYADAPTADATTQRLRSNTDEWRNISGLSDSAGVDLIRADQIDILVDLTMHMPNNRLLVFARKPAPVQVTYLAYCSTTGLDTIDYRLSDPYLDPAGTDESFYSERTIRLPDTYWCYQPIIEALEVAPLPALALGAVTFGCLNNFCKVSQPTLDVWAKLLRQTPNSQLLISACEGNHRNRVHEQMEREGIEPRRVQFVGPKRPADYFRLYDRIDIALDTFPYAGGTTTCDALWMGVPVVSLSGRTAVGRGGRSILSNLGLPQMAVNSEQEYVRVAVDLAADIPHLSQLRSTLRQRMKKSLLMDAPNFARNLETAYRQMWHTWCESSTCE